MIDLQVPEQVEGMSPPAYAARVTRIGWERVHVTIRVEIAALPDAAHGLTGLPPVSFEFVDGPRTFPVDSSEAADGLFDLHINVTTFNGRKGIPNGTWRIRPRYDDVPGTPADYDGRALAALDDASRVFLYERNRSVLTASFGIAENTDSLDFLMRTYAFSRGTGKPKGFHPVKRLRSRLLGDAAKKRYAGRIYGWINRFIGPRPGRILFASDQRLSLEGNLKRVQERLVERGLDSRFDMKYSFRLPKTTGWGTTIRILYLMATSEIILLDDYFGILKSVTFDDRTRVVQLWHAGSGFKAVGYSRFGNPGSPKLWHPHRQYTYAITGSKHLVPVYAEAFGIEESAVIPTGLPRVDWFLDEDRTQAFLDGFYREHPGFEDKRVILFAPTFRGRSIYTAHYPYEWIDFDALYRACGDDTVVLFRMHHFVKDEIPIPDRYRDRFFDFTRFPDGLNLLHAVDLLITDYSSIIYEYSLLDRPMLFFAPDEVTYAATRGFHRGYEQTAPGRICAAFDEVIDALESGDYQQQKVARFREENFDRIDTGSADRVIDWLILNDPHTAHNEAEASAAVQSGAEPDPAGVDEDRESA